MKRVRKHVYTCKHFTHFPAIVYTCSFWLRSLATKVTKIKFYCYKLYLGQAIKFSLPKANQLLVPGVYIHPKARVQKPMARQRHV